MGRKQKLKKWESVLESIHSKPGKSGAFFSAKKLRFVLKDEYKLNVKESQIQNWLEKQSSYTIHKPRRKIFRRNPIIAHYLDHNWQADIGFLTKFKKSNAGFSCFLLCIDVISRFIWGEPMKTKNGPETAKAFETILSRSFPRKPEKIQTDEGKEFYNKHFDLVRKKNDIVIYSTTSDQKAAIAERAIKTIKELISKFLTRNETLNWVSAFQSLILTYNNTTHSSTKMKPSDVNEQTQKKAISNLYSFLWEKDNIFRETMRKPKFNVGDFVRLTKLKNIFKKGYEGYWTTEIFKIAAIFKRKPKIVYKIEDFNGDETIEGTFYEDELSKVNIGKKTFWKIEKILKKKFVGKKLWFFVKFFSYEKPQWIPASNVASDISKVKNVK